MEPRPGVHSIVRVVLDHPSRPGPVVPDVPQEQVLPLEPPDQVAHRAAVPVPVVAQVRVAAGEAQEVEPLVRLVAAAERISLASPSGRSVKSLKCGKPRV